MLERAAGLGWQVPPANIFRETHTGEDLFERPALTRLRQAIARGDIQGVVFYDVDRFARDPVWIEMVTQECLHFGCEIAFVRGGEDLGKDTPEARIMRMLKGYAAQTELGQMKERTARGRRERVEVHGRLRPSSRGPLYGYAFVDAETPDPGKKRTAPKVRYVPNPEQALIVRRIFARSIAGCTIRALAHELERDGVPGPTGKGWSPEMVSKLLNDTAYYGAAFANKSKIVRVREGGAIVKRRMTNPESEWRAYPPGVVPPLIDQATFDAAQQVRTRNKREATRRLTTPEDFLLRNGYVWCGSCGDRMYVRNETLVRARRGVYWCTSRKHNTGLGTRVTIKAETLDAEVWTRLDALLSNPATLAAKIMEMQANDPTAIDLAAVEAQQRQTQQAIVNLTLGIAAVKTDDARAILAEQLDASSAQAARLKLEHERILDRRAGWLEAQQHARDLQRWLGEVRGSTATELPYARKRDALLALGIAVTVYPSGSAERWKMTSTVDFVPTPIGLRSHKPLFLQWSSTAAGVVDVSGDAVA